MRCRGRSPATPRPAALRPVTRPGGRHRRRPLARGTGYVREDGGMDAVFAVPEPRNEPVKGYAPGSAERENLQAALESLAGERHELTLTVDGKQRMGGGDPIDVVQPHNHAHVLGVLRNATTDDATAAVAAAKKAAPMWRDLPFTERAAIFLRVADLLSGP